MIPIVNKQVYRGVGRNIAFGLREGRDSDDVLRRARIAGQQNADFTHGGAIAGGPTGTGVVAGELPVFMRERKALRRGCQERRRTQPHGGKPKESAYQTPVSISMKGNYMRDESVKISESGQGAAHTALGKT